MPSWRNRGRMSPTSWSLVSQSQSPGRLECADLGGFDIQPGANRLNARPIFGRHGQHHPLLRLAQPDFPGPQTGIFERHGFQLHPPAEAPPPFRRRPTTSPPAPQSVMACIESLVAQPQHRFLHLLLVDGMPDLHGASGDAAGGGDPSPCWKKSRRADHRARCARR